METTKIDHAAIDSILDKYKKEPEAMLQSSQSEEESQKIINSTRSAIQEILNYIHNSTRCEGDQEAYMFAHNCLETYVIALKSLENFQSIEEFLTEAGLDFLDIENDLIIEPHKVYIYNEESPCNEKQSHAILTEKKLNEVRLKNGIPLVYEFEGQLGFMQKMESHFSNPYQSNFYKKIYETENKKYETRIGISLFPPKPLQKSRFNASW